MEAILLYCRKSMPFPSNYTEGSSDWKFLNNVGGNSAGISEAKDLRLLPSPTADNS